MLVSVPTTFHVAYKRPPSRAHLQEYFGDWVDVEIKEVSDADAPIATRWTASEATSDGFHETRWYEGHHYYRLENKSYEGISHLDPEGFAEAVAEAMMRNDIISPVARRERDREFVAGSLPNIRTISGCTIMDSGREEAIKDAGRLFAEVLLVDGKMWIRGQEPILRIHPGRNGHHAAIMALASWSSGGIKDHHSYRLDRLDDAIDQAIAEGAVVRQLVVPEVQVMFGASLRYEDEVLALMSAAKWVRDMTKSGIAERPEAEVMAWVRLRDSLEDASSRTEEALSAVVASLHRFATFYADGTGISDRVERATRRWEMRPMELDASTDPETSRLSRIGG